MAEIALTNGGFAYLDDKDVEAILAVNQKWYWHKEKSGKVYAWSRDRTGKIVKMHRLVLSAGQKDLVDHRDGDGLNNRRSNIRICTSRQNNLNVKNRGKVSGYKGVWFHAFSGLWTGTVKHENGWRQSIGYHKTPESAARARDEIARKVHGEFARLNFDA